MADRRAWLRARVRIVGTAALAGLIVGAVAGVALSAYAGDPAFAETQTFAVGALLFGFAVLGWSGSVFAGRGIENMQRMLDAGSDWSEADSRRAMARIGGFGAGVMLSVPLVAAL